jgi:ABC-type uncharacterized transport system auxiliary subunit
MRILSSLAFVSLLSTLISCGGVPPTYYYRVDYQDKFDKVSNGGVAPVTLGVGQFSADLLYESDRIVYRDSEYEAKFYHYRRWVSAPRKMVVEKCIKDFSASNAFNRVVRLPSTQKVDYVLKGRILAFEEWDEDATWFGLVSIGFELQHPKTGAVVWEKVMSRKEPAEKKEPVAVVKAISIALDQVIGQSISEIRNELASLGN